AILTLNKINKHRNFGSGKEVKISRRSVKSTVFITSLFARNARALNLLFDLFSRNLPVTGIREKLGKVNCTAL
ncbi:MAG: hypothetical protein ACRESK_07590, partial [Gammaproteobacteria bacterium]